MENFYYGRFAFVLLFLLLFNLVVKASEVEATMSLQELFNPYADMENGITGTVNSGGKIEVKVFDKQPIRWFITLILLLLRQVLQGQKLIIIGLH